MTPEDRYAALAARFLGRPGVTKDSDVTKPGKAFGSSALKVNGKIFAMLSRGRLVVKLTKARVDALVASGDGERFDPGHGRLMKEWLALDSESGVEWEGLAEEGLGFVGK